MSNVLGLLALANAFKGLTSLRNLSQTFKFAMISLLWNSRLHNVMQHSIDKSSLLSSKYSSSVSIMFIANDPYLWWVGNFKVLYALASTHRAQVHHFRTQNLKLILLPWPSPHTCFLLSWPPFWWPPLFFSSNLPLCIFYLITTLISFDDSDFPFGVPVFCFLALTVPPALQPARLTVLLTATNQSLLTIGKT